jgi:hypothetical protein
MWDCFNQQFLRQDIGFQNTACVGAENSAESCGAQVARVRGPNVRCDKLFSLAAFVVSAYNSSDARFLIDCESWGRFFPVIQFFESV